jgi:hypothetical protein
MGLAERRALAKFQAEQFPPLVKEVHEVVGFEVPIEVDWDSLAIDGSSHLYESCWPPVYFETVLRALRDVCRDDMGKDAIKGALKKIVFKNTNSFSNPRGITFDNGVITVDHKPTTNVDGPNPDDRAKHLIGLLERAL